MPERKNFATSYLPGVILLVFSLVIALFTYRDYGISWDEPIQRHMGMVSYDYVAGGDTSLLIFTYRSHGVAFELPLIFIEKLLHITDSRSIFLMRHLVTHLFFLISVFFGY